MPQKKRMSINARRGYLRALQEEYELAPRLKKSQLLNEMERATGWHRHSLPRLLHSSLERQPRQRQRGRRYGAEEEAVIPLLAEAMDYAWAERLTPNLLSMAEQLAAHGELELPQTLQEKPSRIRASTVRRLSRRWEKAPKKGPPRRAPHPHHGLSATVPMSIIPWAIAQPGHCEIDLVHHCGPATSGDYVYTLPMVDVATGWSERRAVLGRSGLVIHDAFACLFSRFPFPPGAA